MPVLTDLNKLAADSKKARADGKTDLKTFSIRIPPSLVEPFALACIEANYIQPHRYLVNLLKQDLALKSRNGIVCFPEKKTMAGLRRYADRVGLSEAEAAKALITLALRHLEGEG